MALPKIKKGDVFEIGTSKGLGYFQCVKETDVKEMEIIRVLCGVYRNIEEAHLEDLVQQKEMYFLQFPLKYALKKKCIRYITNIEVPKTVVIPRYYRSKHLIGTEFICWHIVDSETLQRRSVKNLSDEEIQLSPWGSWNDTLLAERIAEQWTLDKWI